MLCTSFFLKTVLLTNTIKLPHDIAMDLVVTEAGIYGGAGEPQALPDAGGGEALQLLDAAAAVAHVQNLLLRRDLPRASGK